MKCNIENGMLRSALSSEFRGKRKKIKENRLNNNTAGRTFSLHVAKPVSIPAHHMGLQAK